MKTLAVPTGIYSCLWKLLLHFWLFGNINYTLFSPLLYNFSKTCVRQTCQPEILWALRQSDLAWTCIRCQRQTDRLIRQKALSGIRRPPDRYWPGVFLARMKDSSGPIGRRTHNSPWCFSAKPAYGPAGYAGLDLYICYTWPFSGAAYLQPHMRYVFGAAGRKCSAQELFRSPLHPYTKALFSAIPSTDIFHLMQRVQLKGEIISAINPNSGCRFAPHCQFAKECCHRRSQWSKLRKTILFLAVE